jgi:hypothetical protein
MRPGLAPILCTHPTFLLQAGDPRRPQFLDLHKLGMRRMNGQIIAFARTIEALSAAPASAL